MECPNCKEDCGRDEVDVGVGVIYGPWGCGCCGWSEDPRYNLLKKSPYTRDGILDPRGGLTPPANKELYSQIYDAVLSQKGGDRHEE